MILSRYVLRRSALGVSARPRRFRLRLPVRRHLDPRRLMASRRSPDRTGGPARCRGYVFIALFAVVALPSWPDRPWRWQSDWLSLSSASAMGQATRTTANCALIPWCWSPLCRDWSRDPCPLSRLAGTRPVDLPRFFRMDLARRQRHGLLPRLAIAGLAVGGSALLGQRRLPRVHATLGNRRPHCLCCCLTSSVVRHCLPLRFDGTASPGRSAGLAALACLLFQSSPWG